MLDALEREGVIEMAGFWVACWAMCSTKVPGRGMTPETI